MKRICFNEVATRDGFQIEPGFIPADDKVALVDALSACGYAKIEVTSFTSPKAIPMLRGAERALEARADELNLVMSVSETHNLANLRMPREKITTRAAWAWPMCWRRCSLA